MKSRRAERTKHDQPAPWPAICAGPWRIVKRFMKGLYLFRCENCGDERMMAERRDTTASS